MGRIDGKVAIITGAGSGMGKADAFRFAKEGAKLILTDINIDAVNEVAQQIGNNAIAVAHDVTNEEEWINIINTVVEHHGKLDILVNNAGILEFASVVDTSLDLWRKIHTINLEGPFLGCKHAIPTMEKNNGGVIINMSSISSKQGMGMIAAYASSKGGVESLTREVAAYCKSQQNNIRCNSIHPDGVITPMTAKVSFGTTQLTQEQIEQMENIMAHPEEIASLVLYLATDEARFINGATMLIDNGTTTIRGG